MFLRWPPLPTLAQIDMTRQFIDHGAVGNWRLPDCLTTASILASFGRFPVPWRWREGGRMKAATSLLFCQAAALPRATQPPPAKSIRRPFEACFMIQA